MYSKSRRYINREKSAGPTRSDGANKREKSEEVTDEHEEETVQEPEMTEEMERIQREEDERLINQIKWEAEEREKEQEKKMVLDYIKDIEDKFIFKAENAILNKESEDNWPDETLFYKLDSSLKKNNAFIRKLKMMSDNQKDSLTKEFSSLNHTKFLGEVASAITEVKLKMSDIQLALHLCSLFYRRYPDFSKILSKAWFKILVFKKDEKYPNLSKLRVDLRFYCDLITLSIITLKEGLNVLGSVLSNLTSSKDFTCLPVIVSFIKYCGDEYSGLISTKYSILAGKHGLKIPRSSFLPPERQKPCRNLLQNYFNTLSHHIVSEKRRLNKLETDNEYFIQTKGEVPELNQDKYNDCEASLTKMITNGTIIADYLDEKMPELPQVTKEQQLMGIDIFKQSGEYIYEGDHILFEDDETRKFYETLKDLKAIVPKILYKESLEAGELKKKEQEEEQLKDEGNENINADDVEKDLQDVDINSHENHEEPTFDDMEEEDTVPATIGANGGEGGPAADGTITKLQQLEQYLIDLENCVNRDLIDEAAQLFTTRFNTKLNRRKLVKTLFYCPRTRYDLIPFYSRLVATLNPIMPELSVELVNMLRKDFYYRIYRKDQIHLESKLKVTRFLAELTKFKLFRKHDMLFCLRTLMKDFTHHHIEMVCTLLETCGRFLFRSPDSHHLTKVYLEVLMRKKKALHLDSLYTAQLENAFYYTDPPKVERVAEIIEEHPVLYKFIRQLLYKDLRHDNVDRVIRVIRKMNWKDPEIRRFLMECLSSYWRFKFSAYACLASLLAGIFRIYDEVVIRLIDNVLEDIRISMEHKECLTNQRKMNVCKYLAELYNYRLVNSTLLFRTLYSFISFGAHHPEMDPATDTTRIRMVVTILDGCGMFFDKGRNKEKLNCFLVYLQRYVWVKRLDPIHDENLAFPSEIVNMVADLLTKLRGDTLYYNDPADCFREAKNMDLMFQSDIHKALPSFVVSEEVADYDVNADNHYPQFSPDSDDSDDGGADRGPPVPIKRDIKIHHHHHQHHHRHGSDSDEEDSETEEDSDEIDANESLDSDSGSSGTPSERGRSDGESECEYDDDASSNEMYDMMEDPRHMEEKERLPFNSDEYTDSDEEYDEEKAADKEFRSAFDQMVSESLHYRTLDHIKQHQPDIAIPVSIKAQIKEQVALVPDILKCTDEQPDPNVKKLILMTRKGNKQIFSPLEVPVSESLASKIAAQEKKQKKEQVMIKQVVLDCHERQEQEEYQEMLQTRAALVSNLIKIKDHKSSKYTHQKGVPDMNDIF